MERFRLSAFGTGLVLAVALLACGGSLVEAAEEDSELEGLREQLAATETPEQWEEKARELLAALDRQGLSRSPEAFSLVERLIDVAPESPVLLWRRADMERRSGRSEEAIADLEYLIELAGDHPLAVRARRALPALYLRVGRPEKSAEADERLLEEGLADPVAVSLRLARTYAALDRPKDLRRTLDRIEAIEPGRLETDPDLMWLSAMAAAESKSKRQAADALLRFANLHTKDPRWTEAMVRASGLYGEVGRRSLAIELLEQVLAAEPELSLAMEARLRMAELLDASGQSEASRAQLTKILDVALSPQTVADALRLLLDTTEERHGLEAAVAQAASLIAAGDRFHVEMARNHLDRLVRELEPRLRGDPPRLLYYYDMLRGVEQEAALSPRARLTVGGLLERMGMREQAATVYETLVNNFGPERAEAREGMLRAAPRVTPADGQAELVLRLEALAREEAWGEIREVLDGKRLSSEAPEEVLAVAARARFDAGQAKAAAGLLSELSAPGGELAVLRGDARALAGEWEEACSDYRRAAEEPLSEPLAFWLEWRLATCEMREGEREAARRRLAELRRSEPGPPVELLVDQPMSSIRRASALGSVKGASP